MRIKSSEMQKMENAVSIDNYKRSLMRLSHEIEDDRKQKARKRGRVSSISEELKDVNMLGSILPPDIMVRKKH